MPFTFVFKGSFEGLAHLLGQIDGFAQRGTAGHLTVNGRLLTIQGADIAVQNSSGLGLLRQRADRDDHRHRVRAARQPGADRWRHRARPERHNDLRGGLLGRADHPRGCEGDAMSEILRSLKSDLLDRRLLPIVVALCLALAGAVAYVVLDGGGERTGPDALGRGRAGAAPSPVSHGPNLAVSEAHANPHVAVAETTEGARYRHKPGSHDPFTPLPSPKTASEATAKSSGSSSVSSPSTSSSSTSVEKAAPARPTRVARRPPPRLP